MRPCLGIFLACWTRGTTAVATTLTSKGDILKNSKLMKANQLKLMKKHNKTSFSNSVFKMEFSLLKIDSEDGLYFGKN